LHSAKWNNGEKKKGWKLHSSKKKKSNSIEDFWEIKKMDTQILTSTKQ
jgi:hypothetical protein